MLKLALAVFTTAALCRIASAQASAAPALQWITDPSDYDAQGKEVGTPALPGDGGRRLVLWFRYARTPFLLVVSESHLAPVDGFQVVTFALPKSTGQAFVHGRSGPSVLSRVTIGYPNRRCMSADASEGPNTILSESEVVISPDGVVTLSTQLHRAAG